MFRVLNGIYEKTTTGIPTGWVDLQMKKGQVAVVHSIRGSRKARKKDEESAGSSVAGDEAQPYAGAGRAWERPITTRRTERPDEEAARPGQRRRLGGHTTCVGVGQTGARMGRVHEDTEEHGAGEAPPPQAGAGHTVTGRGGLASERHSPK